MMRTRLAKDEDPPEAVNSQMHDVQSDPAPVRAFFDHPAVAYAKQPLKGQVLTRPNFRPGDEFFLAILDEARRQFHQ
jgi:hypothetical protein